MKHCASVLFLWCLSVTLVTSHPDEVLDLPGLSFKPNFTHYSGYLNASSGKYLHYWFVESEHNPAYDPLVLWMNGGPGCSSLHAMLAEHGPFRIKKDGKTLYRNPHSWNKLVNVIYLEAPAGVGFSYADDDQYVTDDDQTAEDNYLALQYFFVKFPQFKRNHFFIMGEGYAGIYVSTLSVLVLNRSADINFKGYAIGNGMLDVNKFQDSIVFFAYYHGLGLFGQTVLNNIKRTCCNDSAFSHSTCEFATSTSSICRNYVKVVLRFVQVNGVNIHNIHADCALSDGMLPTSDDSDLKTLQCIDSRNISNWINQPGVRTALHILSNLTEWTLCSAEVRRNYKGIYQSMKPQILTLIQSGRLKGLFYNGDLDMAYNFLGTQWFVEDLHLRSQPQFTYAWKFQNQFAGFAKYFEGGLTFATIKGSGHMVSQDKPGPAFKMITRFLYQVPFT